MNLVVQPIALADANRFVVAHHHHSRHVVGHLWSVGLWSGLLELRGVAIVGRPVARALDDGLTVEVTRLATDGVRNGCSALYAACRREACRRGFQRVVTYTLASESGSSLRGAGWTPVARVRGRDWDTPARRRHRRTSTPDRIRWEAPR